MKVFRASGALGGQPCSCGALLSVVELLAKAEIAYTSENRKGLNNRTAVEYRIYFLLSFIMWLSGRQFRAKSISFTFPEPGFAEDYRHLVPTTYFFGQERNALHLESALMRALVR